MHRFSVCGTVPLLGVLFLSTWAFAQANSSGFTESSWIWHAPIAGEKPGNYAASARYFRAEFSLPESPDLKTAELIVTCDNLFIAYVNGRPVGESDTDNNAWKRPKRFDLTGLLSPGRVVLAIEAINTLPGHAGLLAQLTVTLSDGRKIVVASDDTWRASLNGPANWRQVEFDDQQWPQAKILGTYGAGPWGLVSVPKTAEPPSETVGAVRTAIAETISLRPTNSIVERGAEAGELWPEAVVFVGDDCSLYRPGKTTGNSAYDSLSVTIFNPRKSRTYPEHDLPAPMKVGRKLMVLRPARPGVSPAALVDAGQGALGSPSVSFDGAWVYFSMAREGDSFYHLYRVPAAGGAPQQLTDGPFFDIEPAELPDGRIVFVSTRVGTFEEYHSPPSRALYVMNPDGTNLRPITHTIIFDNEPEVLADGRIIFIRSDNFFDRGKVETQLHATFPDGSHGYTDFGLDRGPEYGMRLRPFNCGSPAPMPDGRVAYLSTAGITVGRMGQDQRHHENYVIEAGDVAALPDNRLLCTTAPPGSGNRYDKIGVLDLAAEPPSLVTLHQSGGAPLHSPVYLGPRTRPPVRAVQAEETHAPQSQATGVLFCQNARFTKNTTAGWEHVRAIRVLAGTGLTTRSSHSYIVHAGNETIELGTVPLAPDGSFCIEVPADTPIALQAVDGEGRSELNEMSWIYVRPGERRSCVGCHQPRQSAPLAEPPRAMALMAPPLQLLGRGEPHRFRGNNAAVTGLMELQFDRFREVAGINRHGEAGEAPSGRRSEVAALVAYLREGDQDQKIASAQRLAIFRAREAAAALAACLESWKPEVRTAAALALAACGTRASVAPLLDALSDGNPLVAQSAAVALENLTGHAEDYNPFVSETEPIENAEGWRTWFGNTSWRDIEAALIETLQTGGDAEIRRAAVALGHIGGPSAAAALRRHLEKEQGKNPHPAWRRNGHQGDNARFNALSPVNPRTLQAVVRALGRTGGEADVASLANVLDSHCMPETGN